MPNIVKVSNIKIKGNDLCSWVLLFTVIYKYDINILYIFKVLK